MKFIVCIASHLGSPQRHVTIEHALTSLSKQTVLPDFVIISYSYVHKPNTQKWHEILKDLKHLFLDQGATKTLQFMHYYLIHNYLIKELMMDDILMFLDDDDIYHESKVQSVREAFMDTNLDIVSHQFDKIGVWYTTNTGIDVYPGMKMTENWDLVKNSIHFPGVDEYFNYCVRLFILRDFFEYFDINKYENTGSCVIDCCFLAFLQKRLIFKIEKVLLYQRVNLFIPKDWTKK